MSNGDEKKIKVEHHWLIYKLDLAPFLPNRYHIERHNLAIRFDNRLIAIWNGSVLRTDDNDDDESEQAPLYQSRWIGRSVSLVQNQTLVNATWYLHSVGSISCWFGDSYSIDGESGKTITYWTHLMEFSHDDDTWSGFIMARDRHKQAHFWLGNGSSPDQLMKQQSWVDQTSVWLKPIDEHFSSNVSTMWILIGFIFSLVVCLFMLFLVNWCTWGSSSSSSSSSDSKQSQQSQQHRGATVKIKRKNKYYQRINSLYNRHVRRNSSFPDHQMPPPPSPSPSPPSPPHHHHHHQTANTSTNVSV